HPLALSLEQGHLKRLDDEHSITDRLRTDIDEGHEIKDAVLLLRRNEIKRLEQVRASLSGERDTLAEALVYANAQRDQALAAHLGAREQIQIQACSIAALQAELYSLQHASPNKNAAGGSWNDGPDVIHVPNRHSRSRTKSPEKKSHEDSNLREENARLRATVRGQEQEIYRFIGGAMGRGTEVVSRSFQGMVDEAVRREREKDAFVIKDLRDAVARLSGK
ncbi:hypothetical protein LTR53_017302, partial [Teratosphaeriaceae sp. CCFEE 6253]